MAFNVRLWKLTKATNSTAVPAQSAEVVTYQCIAIEPMSLSTPVIRLLLPNDNQTADMVKNYNYMYLAPFNRFYWITDWEYRDRCWFVHGSVDALATYRYEIGELEEYILRASADYNGTIQDNLYPARSAWSSAVNEYASHWTQSLTLGAYSVGIIGAGETNFYLMSRTNLGVLMDWVMSDAYCQEVLTSLAITAYPEAKAVIDPLQYIASVTYLPILIDASRYSPHTIHVGYSSKRIDCLAITNYGALEQFSTSMTIPRHPLAASRGTYLNNAPYSYYDLYYPPFGVISLDPAICAGSSSLTATAYVDMHTGNASLIINNDVGRVISRIGGRLGIPMQLSQVITPGYGILSAAKDAAGILSGIEGGTAGLIGSGIGSIVNGIGNAINGSIPSANTIGSIGSVDAIQGPIQLQAMYAMPVQDDLWHRGRPLCDIRKINTIPGYIMCADVEVHILGATSIEMDMIKAAMEGGFYYV